VEENNGAYMETKVAVVVAVVVIVVDVVAIDVVIVFYTPSMDT